MTKTLSWLMTAVMCALVFLTAGCTQETARGGKAFDQVFENLDLQKNTKLHAEEYWKSVKGQECASDGMVVDVRRDNNGAEVFVARPGHATSRDFNVVLAVPDVAQAAALNRRQHIRFRGLLSEYRADRDGGVVLTLRTAEIVK